MIGERNNKLHATSSTISKIPSEVIGAQCLYRDCRFHGRRERSANQRFGNAERELGAGRARSHENTYRKQRVECVEPPRKTKCDLDAALMTDVHLPQPPCALSRRSQLGMKRSVFDHGCPPPASPGVAVVDMQSFCET